jgi:tetraacyldisaccharide 4'-kinase
VPDGDWLNALWDGDGVAARAGRAALLPLELLFGAVAGVRRALYANGVLASLPTAVPALSVGNLTVGGTGKTPLAAWLARRMRDEGAAPGIVLRGYGDDEPLVHAALNPDVPVIVSRDRVAASLEAQQRGCDVVVLDDAFQHQRARRVADVVVISADKWRRSRPHLLPAGPWREPLTAARRASLVVVTRKAARLAVAESVADELARVARIASAVVHLDPNQLRRVDAHGCEPVTSLRGESVLAISGVGDPAAFHAQLAGCGAKVVPVPFRDHHRFTTSDASALASAAARCDRAVCTLKDAVKLGSLWPGPTPLWYVSQRVDVERGADALDHVIATVLAARSASTPLGRPGSPGPPA